jgi:hypothetical protein
MFKDFGIGDVILRFGELSSLDQVSKEILINNVTWKIKVTDSKIEISQVDDLMFEDSDSTTYDGKKSSESPNFEDFSENSSPLLEGHIEKPYVSLYKHCSHRYLYF